MEFTERKIKEVDKYIQELSGEIKTIAVTLRDIIFNSSDKLKEEFKWSMPNYSYNGRVCYIQTAKNHVNLGFQRGNELKDPNNLLQGTGKKIRHIRIEKMEDIEPEILTSFIKTAVDLNETKS